VRATVLVIVLGLAAWALCIAPRGFVSGDSGVKLIQAHDLWQARFASRALHKVPPFTSYSRAGGDFERVVGTDSQGIYSIAFVAPAAVLTGLFGRGAIPVLPLVGGVLAIIGLARLLAAWRVSRHVAVAALVSCAFATPLLLYSSQFFEHSLATGLVTLGIAELERGRGHVLVGMLVALAAALRPECYCAVAALGVASVSESAPLAQRARRGAAFLAGALAVLVPFWIVNQITAGAWDPLVAADHGNHQNATKALIMLWGDLPDPRFWMWVVPFALPLGLAVTGRRGPIAITTTAALFGCLAWRATASMDARILAGMFAVTPLAAIGLLAGPRRPAWIFAVLFVAQVIALDKSGTGGGLQLGARLLLPALPVLVALAADVVDRRRSWIGVGSAALLVVAGFVYCVHGMAQAHAIAHAGEQATEWAIAAPGQMIVAKRDWEAGVVAPALLEGKEVLISHARTDDAIFRVLAARGDPGCVYISPNPVALSSAITTSRLETEPDLMTVQAIALGPRP
jgi:hypothetical protein